MINTYDNYFLYAGYKISKKPAFFPESQVNLFTLLFDQESKTPHTSLLGKLPNIHI